MAPALTEPLSPTNKLSASTSSASPRPISNSLLKNSNINSTVNNVCQTTKILKNNSFAKTTGNNIYRNSSRTCAFQTAFEESIKKSGISIPEPSAKQKKTNRSIVTSSIVIKPSDSISAKTNLNTFKENFSQASEKRTKTESSPTTGITSTSLSKPISSSLGKTIDTSTNGPESLLLFPKKPSNWTLTTAVNEQKQQMGPMSDTTIKNSHIATVVSESKINQGFIPINKNFEEALNKSLQFSNNNNDRKNEENQILIKFDTLQQMDLSIPTSDDTEHVKSDNKEIISQTTPDEEEAFIPECEEKKNQLAEIEFSQEIVSTVSTGTTDTTITASESEHNFLDDNFQESNQPICSQQTPIKIRKSPPRTPISSSQQQITPCSSILTPQSTGSGSIGLQKDFKDTEMVDQVLSDMDLLQVLKGFDSTSGGENLCELAGSLGLFNDVDVMNYEEISVPNVKDCETREVRCGIEKTQYQMERKCDFLLRRLRKVQARYMGKHASEEITGLFEWTNRLVRRKDQHGQIPQMTYEDEKHRHVSATAMRTLLRKIDSVATAQHSSSSDPTSMPLKKYKSGRASVNPNNQLAEKTSGSTVVIKAFDDKTTDEMGHISGLLQTETREIQCAFDSDATASSSGGESADEMVTYNNQQQQPLTIAKRAGWRWAKDRSAVASRWTWLCAQIADLEYRIRQHNDLHVQIKKNKGAVTFEKLPIISEPIKNNCTTDGSSIGASGSVDTTSTNSVNGYCGVLPGNVNNNICPSKTQSQHQSIGNKDDSGDISVLSNEDELIGACRTRPFQRAGFRKRKLLQTANVHTVSKKAARSSTIKCGCQWPYNPCALCTGRLDPMAPRDLPDTMIPTERVALLDSSFHPVLSFAEDVSNSIHIEATLQIPEWQNRLIRNLSKTNLKTTLAQKLEDRSISSNSGSYTKKHKPYQKHNRKDVLSSTSTNKVKKNRKNQDCPSELLQPHYSTTQSQHYSNSSVKSKHRKLSSSTTLSTSGSGCEVIPPPPPSSSQLTLSMNGFQNAFAESLSTLQCDNLDGATSSNGLLPRSKNASPTHNSGNYKYERMMDRRNRNSYDIDSIVIPYSVAAATRVEILPYKEIPTPKWRIVDSDGEDLNEPNIISSNEKKSQNDEILALKNSCKSGSKEINNETSSDNILVNYSKDTLATSTTEKSIDNVLLPICNAITMSSLQNKQKLEKDVKQVPSQSSRTNNEIEDVSPEAVQSRHDRALLEERKKFATYLKFPWSTRSRANRRIDSRAESSGANTPDPTSPAPHIPSVVCDQESIPSPVGQTTPLSQMDITTDGENIQQNNPLVIYPPVNSIYYSAVRRERKRTVSAKKDKDVSILTGSSSTNKDDLRRSQSPETIREIIQPYEPLQFPIPDEEFDTMLEMMPNNDEVDESFKSLNDNSDLPTNNCGIASSNSSIINEIQNQNKSIISRKNSISLNFGDSVNDNNNSSSIFSTSKDISNNLCNIKKQAKTFEEFDSIDRDCRLLLDSDTDSVESNGQDDPNDPEWREPE